MRYFFLIIFTLTNRFCVFSQAVTRDSIELIDFPVSFFFRVPQNQMDDGYKKWETEFERANGMITKAVHEEIANARMDTAQQFIKQFKAEHPEQMALLHLNGRSRDPYDNQGQYFSGHWLYLPGCMLQKDIGKSDSIIYVADTRVFRLNIQKKGRGVQNDQICMVPLNSKGEKDWLNAEHLKLKHINHSKGYIVVERAQFGSQARQFAKGETYLAPHAAKGPFGKHMLWEYNVSTHCPRNAKGHQATDVFVNEIKHWFSHSAISKMDGIAFDVTDFDHKGTCQGRYVDVNNDGIGDDGVVNNRNIHGEGLYLFFRKLRSVLGDSTIITADGHNPDSQVAINLLNGMESEGLCTHNDPYRAWSKTVNYINYWQKNTTKLPAFNYIAVKNVEDKPAYPVWSNERFAMGTATCLGVAYTENLNAYQQKGFKYIIKDETVAGVLNQKNWLGQPLGEMQYYFPDGYDNMIIDLKAALDSGFIKTKNCQMVFADKVCRVLKQDSSKPMSLELQVNDIENSDALISIDCKAARPMDEYGVDVPYKYYLKLSESGLHNAKELYALCDSKDFTTSFFYIRNGENVENEFVIHFENGDAFELTNIRIKKGMMVAYRTFEHGVVLVNPSCQKQTVNTSLIFPGLELKHIEGTKWQRRKDPYDINTGQAVDEFIKVHPIDAMFLHAH